MGCYENNLFAQNIQKKLKRCPLKTINFEQGLSNNTTTSAVTDEFGFTWIASKTGLQRYNGYILETINPLVDKHIVNINSLVFLFALQNGLIWISYKQGVLEYNPQTNSFKKLITLEKNNINFSIIPVLQTDKEVWCLETGKGLVAYSFETGVILKVIGISDAFMQNVFNRQEIYINSTFTVNEHSIFIYNGKNQVQEIDIQTEKVSLLKTDAILSLVCNTNNLYTVSNSSLTSINIATKRTEKSISFKNIFTENIFIASSFYLPDNKLFISLNSHAFEFDTACNYKYEFTGLNRTALLTFGFINTIYADRFKRIWLLTNDDIKRVQNFDIPFEHLMYNDKNNFIRSIYYDEQKHFVLAGCYNGGIQLYDTSGNALWQTALLYQTVKDISGIEKLTNNEYLVVTIGKGLYILNLPSKKIKPLFQANESSGKINARYINFTNNQQRINDSTILITTSLNIYKCIFKNGNCVLAKPLLPSYIGTSDILNCFLYSLNKTLWVGTATGKIYSIDSSAVIHKLQIPESYLVRNISEDAQHNIWVGTDKGLFVYNNSQLIKDFNTQTGLLNDCIYAVLPVKNKAAVYASTNLGLSYVSLNENIINYTKESGLQENEFNTQSAIRTANGKYFFGGVNGITSFYPSALLNIKDTPVLNITNFIVNDSSYNNLPGNRKDDSIKLNYSQNHIQFDIAALGLLNTNEYVYKYRLLGFENNWQTTHEPVGIKYVLEPKTYVFEISCSPVFSLKSAFTKSIVIIISPPVWQTWWFKILIVLAGIIIIALIVRQYLNSLYQKKLNALKLTQEIQHERERISHDLHDNLGAYAAAIASNISTIQTTKQSLNTEAFHQLKNNSQSIINQLNDTIWALNKKSIYLTAVSDRFKVFIQKLRLSYPSINIQIKENIVYDELLSPANALHLFRIMQEAANNALKHSEGNDVFIEFSSDKKWIVIIKDNGKGMPEEEGNILYGNGLNNIKTRAKAAGWNVRWISEPQNGTEVLISSATTN